MNIVPLSQPQPATASREQALREMVDFLQAFARSVQMLIDIEEDRAASSSQMLSPKDLAERWGRSPSHVRGLCASGKIKAVREGRDWLITEQAAAVYLRKLGVR